MPGETSEKSNVEFLEESQVKLSATRGIPAARKIIKETLGRTSGKTPGEISVRTP